MCPPHRVPSRRRILQQVALLGSGLFTGCLSTQFGKTVDAISIYNATDNRIEVTVTVRELPDEDPIIDDNFELNAEDSRSYPQPFTEDGEKQLTIVVNETRRSTYRWTANTDSDNTGLDIVVQQNQIDIDQISA